MGSNFSIIWGGARRATRLGFFIKGAARVVRPPRLEYRGFKFKIFNRGEIVRLLIGRQCGACRRVGGGAITTTTNAAITLKRRHDVQSQYLRGPTFRQLGRKRLLVLFRYVV